MSKSDRFAPVFQRIIDAPDSYLDALRTDAAAFETMALEETGEQAEAGSTLPYRHSLGFLLFDKQGKPLPLGEPDWVYRFDSFDALLNNAEQRSSDGRLLYIQADGRKAFGLWAPMGETSGWNLPERVRQAAGNNGEYRLIMVTASSAGVIETAAQGFGLSNLQQRVAIAVIRTGNLRDAATQLGISYATAREAMAASAKRMFLPNMPAVVRALVMASFGVLPEDFDGTRVLADMLRLTERQARLALLISMGASREEAARAIGSRPGVVKKELEGLFANFGIKSAAELSRLIVEVQALRLFARATDGTPGFLDPSIEPSRFAIRPNGLETIGWSDYGPASGRPVLIVHSNWSCRAVSRRLLGELQRRGWRPIAIDRPGFGSTHLGTASQDDPFSQAVADTLQILDACKIARIPVIARCGAQYVHALQTAVPERVAEVVLVSPTPGTTAESKRHGVVGAVKEAFYRRPRLIEFFFRLICTQLSLERAEQLTRAIVKGCKVDEALCDDPQFIRDRFRALRPFTTGNFIGGVIEEHVISSGVPPLAPLAQAGDWTILQGDDDIHNSVEEVRSYWSRIVPEARFEEIEGGGRFLTSSHPELVVDRLEELQQRKAVA